MSYTKLPTRSSSDPNASADINQLQDNITYIAFKQYVSGNTYNSVALDITGLGDTTTANDGIIRGVFIPYQTIDGAWYCNIKINGTLDVAANSATITTAGLVFKNVSNFFQPGSIDPGTAATNNSRLLAYPNTGNIVFTANYNRTAIYTNGDYELNSKPTWAD